MTIVPLLTLMSSINFLTCDFPLPVTYTGEVYHTIQRVSTGVADDIVIPNIFTIRNSDDLDEHVTGDGTDGMVIQYADSAGLHDLFYVMYSFDASDNFTIDCFTPQGFAINYFVDFVFTYYPTQTPRDTTSVSLSLNLYDTSTHIDSDSVTLNDYSFDTGNVFIDIIFYEIPSSLAVSYDDYVSTGNYQLGYDTGYDKGFKVGQSSNDSYYQGFADGQDLGHTQGYQEGLRDGSDGVADFSFMSLFGAIADTPIMILRNLLGFDLFGVSAISILMTMITGCIVFFLIRKII